MPNGRKRFGTEFYQIKIKGHLEERWAEWFEEMTFTHEKDGTTTLYGPLPDQTALHSILRKIRDLNLQLISVKQVNFDTEDENLNNSEGGADAD